MAMPDDRKALSAISLRRLIASRSALSARRLRAIRPKATTGPTVDPVRRECRCLVAVVAPSAVPRALGRDCWPQGQPPTDATPRTSGLRVAEPSEGPPCDGLAGALQGSILP